MKKSIALIMAALLVGATSVSAVGCNREEGQKYDEKKSLLNIGVFNAGYGIAWAEQAEKDFEKFYEKISFEEGKKGVDVVLDPKKEEFKATNLATTMSSYQNTLYFLNEMDFNGFYRNDLLVDITDTLNEKIYDADGYLAAATGGEAVSSMNDIMYDVYKGKDGEDGYYEINGRAYAAPWSFDVAGIIYDADLFNENKYYFDAEGNIGCNQEDIDAGNCGTGPDMEMGTPDDGMPVTWNDFLDLMYHMKNGGDNVTPFVWSGGTLYQKQRAYEAVWANYEGYDDYMLNFTMNGTDAQLGEITEATADKLCQQEGIKAAIQAASDIVNGGYYDPKSATYDYTRAQTVYISSLNETNRIAMLFENGYWENEARDTFDLMDMGAGTGYGERNFKIFPIPNFVGVEGITDQAITAEPETLIGHRAYLNCAVIAKQNSCTNDYQVQLELAKLFLQFVNSREQLVNFTANTGGCIGAYQFTPNEEEIGTFTKFGQNIFDYVKHGSKFALDVPMADLRRNNVTDFENAGYFYVKESFNGKICTYVTPYDLYIAQLGNSVGTSVSDVWSYMQKSYKDLIK